MKKLAVKKDAKCMACLACVRACSEAFFKVFDPKKSCIQILAGKNDTVKPAVCVQCGKCARTCEFGAITQNPKTGVFMINKKLCTNCGKCIEACPMQVMVADPTSKCIACGICVKSCPMDVLEIIEK